MYREYKDMNSKIHAPAELKHKVLLAARASKGQQPKRHISPWSFLRKAAVAAALAVFLPITAVAAANQMGLLEHLQMYGMKDTSAAEELLVEFTTEPDATAEGTDGSVQEEHWDYADSIAEYRIVEALCDSDTIYIVADVRPVSEEYFLIPGYLGWNDDASNLLMEGVDTGGMNCEEYALSLGKTPAAAQISFDLNGEMEQGGGYWSVSNPDSSFRVYYSSTNSTGASEFSLDCSCVSMLDGHYGTDANRGSFSYQMTDNSVTSEQSFTQFDQRIATETPFTVKSMTVRSTQIGTYVDFVFTYSDDTLFFDIRLVDENGDVLPNMPGISSGTKDNGDGTYSTTRYYQRIEDLSKAYIGFYVPETGEHYGPYTFQ